MLNRRQRQMCIRDRWRLKRAGPQPAGIIHVPRWVPASGLVASISFLLMQSLFDLGG